jgi:hypothetical protein
MFPLDMAIPTCGVKEVRVASDCTVIEHLGDVLLKNERSSHKDDGCIEESYHEIWRDDHCQLLRTIWASRVMK